MSGPLRRPTIPQCTACLRSYTYGAFDALPSTTTPARTQTRGKKRMANNSATVPVKLLKDMPTFGKAGHILPIARGQMRNRWFPEKAASYLTLPETRTLRLSGAILERDFAFGAAPPPPDPSTAQELPQWQQDIPTDIKTMSTAEIQDASAFQSQPALEPLTPERSLQLLERFVPGTLEFYRQPILEELAPKPAEAEKVRKEEIRIGGAAGDLLAARRKKEPEVVAEMPKEQRIYGSVSVRDVVVAMRAAMEGCGNEEAGRVVLGEEDVRFVGMMEGKVTRVGEFEVEVKVDGVEGAEGGTLRRAVKVIAQEM